MAVVYPDQLEFLVVQSKQELPPLTNLPTVLRLRLLHHHDAPRNFTTSHRPGSSRQRPTGQRTTADLANAMHVDADPYLLATAYATVLASVLLGWHRAHLHLDQHRVRAIQLPWMRPHGGYCRAARELSGSDHHCDGGGNHSYYGGQDDLLAESCLIERVRA